ncbi:MAG: hypothetical protein RR512_04930 [Coprobacillus sp.]
MKEIISQLSAREKKMLYVLSCFLIIIGGWFFVVVPGLDSYSALNVEYDNVVYQKPTLEKQLEDYLAAPALLKTKKDSYEDIINKYNKKMSNEQIDKMITTALLAHGLKPKSLSITGVQSVTSANATDAAADNKSTTTQDNAVVSNLLQATVSVSVEGTMQQMSNLTGYLNKLKGVQISSLSYTSGALSKSTVQLSIIVYMIDK